MTKRVILFAIFCFAISTIDAKNINNASARMKYYQDKIDSGNVSFDKLIPIYDSIIALCYTNELTEFRIKLSMDKAKVYDKNSNYEKTFKVYQETLEDINAHFSPSLSNEKKECMYSIALTALKLKMFDQSITYAFQLLDYLGDRDLNYKAQTYSMLSHIFGTLNNTKESSAYSNKAFEIMKNADTLNSKTCFSVYNTKASLFFDKCECDSIIKYLSKAQKFIGNTPSDVSYQNIIYHNFSVMYYKIREYDIAEEYLLKALDMLKNSDNSQLYLTASNHFNLALLYKEMNRTEDAIDQYNEAIKISSQIGLDQIKCNALIAISEILYAKGEYQKSRDYLNAGQQIKDSLFDLQNSDRVLLLSSSFEAKQKELEIRILQDKVEKLTKKSETVETLTFITLSISILLIGFLIIKLRKQKSTTSLLDSENHKLQTEVDYYKHDADNQILTTVDVKNRELTTITLSLIKANSIFIELEKLAKKVNDAQEPKDKLLIFESFKEIINQYHPEKGWDEFKFYFEQVHQSFFIKLNEEHPDLTYSQQRICAMITLNLSTKEIADMTNKSIRTIETTIYKIRKKCGISGDVRMITYLNKFLGNA